MGQTPKSLEKYILREKIEIKSPKDAFKLGIVLVPEDRKLQGLILNMAFHENLSLPTLPFMFSNKLLNFKREYKLVEDFVDKLRIRTPHIFK